MLDLVQGGPCAEELGYREDLDAGPWTIQVVNVS